MSLPVFIKFFFLMFWQREERHFSSDPTWTVTTWILFYFVGRKWLIKKKNPKERKVNISFMTQIVRDRIVRGISAKKFAYVYKYDIKFPTHAMHFSWLFLWFLKWREKKKIFSITSLKKKKKFAKLRLPKVHKNFSWAWIHVLAIERKNLSNDIFNIKFSEKILVLKLGFLFFLFDKFNKALGKGDANLFCGLAFLTD